MRKVILGVAVSLDSFIEGPNGEYDWCFTDQDYGMSDFFKRIDAVFLGRKSYELVQATEGSSDWMPKMEEFVFSTTLESVPEGKTLIRDHIQEQVTEIKNRPGKDIWLFGGASLTTTLMQLGLVDELWLSVHPILLGKGKPLFSDVNNRIQLTLLKSKTYHTGLVSLIYKIEK